MSLVRKPSRYSALGRHAFEKNNMAGTISNYQSALKVYQKLPALNAEAYYHIGFAHMKQQNAESAMKSFACGQAFRKEPLQETVPQTIGVPVQVWAR